MIEAKLSALQRRRAATLAAGLDVLAQLVLQRFGRLRFGYGFVNRFEIGTHVAISPSMTHRVPPLFIKSSESRFCLQSSANKRLNSTAKTCVFKGIAAARQSRRNTELSCKVAENKNLLWYESRQHPAAVRMAEVFARTSRRTRAVVQADSTDNRPLTTGNGFSINTNRAGAPGVRRILP